VFLEIMKAPRLSPEPFFFSMVSAFSVRVSILKSQ
jgi:hypothetical protein